MDTESTVRMLILIPTLVFLISTPKSIFRQICAEEVKITMFMIFFPPSLTLLQFGALCTLCCIYLWRACNIIEKQ